MNIERRAWQWLDWSMFGFLTFFLAIGILYASFGTIPFDIKGRLLVSFCLFVCYYAVLLFWRPGYTHRWGLPLAVLLTSGSLELYLVSVLQDYFTIVALQLILVGFHAKCKQIIFNAAAFVVFLPIAEGFLMQGPDGFNLSYTISHSLNSVLLLAIGYSIQRVWLSHYGIKQLYEENLKVYRLVQEQNKALEQYANQIEQMTLVEERNRLARELHDTVGHTFTSVIMGMDAVSYLMDTAPEKAKEKLDVLRQVTRNGLEEVRRSIHQIAPPPEEGTLPQQLTRLAEDFSNHTGTAVSISTTGEECELSRHVQLILIRCLQESITNAKRHGQAENIRIGLEYGEKRFFLTIVDNGSGSDNVEAGFGLTSMRERLASVQGILEVTSSAGQGTRVVCSVPLRRTIA